MSNSLPEYSLDDLPSEVTLLPMSYPEDVLENAESRYTEVEDHVYVSGDEHVVLADIYGAGQTIDRMKDAIDGGAETFNLVGLCVAERENFSAGDVIEPRKVHGVDPYSSSTEPSYVREPEEFPHQESIDHRTRHASVPAVNYDAFPYFKANNIESGDMETAAAIMASEGGERTDIESETVEDVSVRSALSVFDTFEDGISQEDVWSDSEISREQAYKEATTSAAKMIDLLASQ